MKGVSRSSLRRSQALVLYWEDEQLVLENFLTGERRFIGTDVVAVLDHFSRWRSPNTRFTNASDSRPGEIRRVVKTLTAGSFLQQHGQRHTDRDVVARWRAWHPTASYFHFATKNAPFPRTSKGDAEVETDLKARVSNRPPSTKRYRGLPTTRLPPPATSGEFPAVLLGRRTWRRFGLGPIDLQALSTLLALTFGVQWKVSLDVVGTVHLTTSPSGGARHPLEAYAVVQRVTNLQPGLYHYQSDGNRLTRIGGKASRREIAACFPGQSWCADAAVIVFMTAVFRRTQWKYPDPQAYRVLLAEAGHVCQTFCLVATWLGLAPYCTMALADSTIEKYLRIDGITESVVYVAGVGPRPRGTSWAPWPDAEALPNPHPTRVIRKADRPVLKGTHG